MDGGSIFLDASKKAVASTFCLSNPLTIICSFTCRDAEIIFILNGSAIKGGCSFPPFIYC